MRENESVLMESKNNTELPRKPRTFPNGLVIEELSMGQPNGKRASPGKTVISCCVSFYFYLCVHLFPLLLRLFDLYAHISIYFLSVFVCLFCLSLSLSYLHPIGLSICLSHTFWFLRILVSFYLSLSLSLSHLGSCNFFFILSLSNYYLFSLFISLTFSPLSVFLSGSISTQFTLYVSFFLYQYVFVLHQFIAL